MTRRRLEDGKDKLMKHSYDTYRLYSDEKIFTFSVRVKASVQIRRKIG